MWLKFGVAPDPICGSRQKRVRTLLTIADVASGKTNLTCPFCDSLLTAKKGRIKEHHFAHLSGQTCLRVKRGEIPTLPLYDNFHLKLNARDFQLVKDLWREYKLSPHPIIHVPFNLRLKKIFDRFGDGYQFTDLGKISVGGLSLAGFNLIQEPLILGKLAELTKSVAVASGISSARLEEKKADLGIYQLQIQRILQLSLYFLEINAEGKTFHKIGVTKREMSERLKEIKRDLNKHFENFEIKILGTWKHRGNVELYFKHRYQPYNYRIGKLTEYFQFENIASVCLDLQQMTPKLLNNEELAIYQHLDNVVLN